MTKAKKIVKKIAKIAGAGLLGVSLLVIAPVATPKAEADWGQIFDYATKIAQRAAQIENARNALISAGDNPMVQLKLMGEQLTDVNNRLPKYRAQGYKDEVSQEEIDFADGVMKQLIDKGNYAMHNHSLPFRWQVVNDPTFNACCDYADSITINHGLLKELHYNRDEVAAVLSHEMIHGLNMHVLHNVVGRMTTDALVDIGEMAANTTGYASMGIDILNNYYKAKNIDLNNEAEADKEGFFLLASAGFNPGAMPALMSRMKYFSEHQNDFADFFNPSVHPKTKNRLRETAKLLKGYSLDHVEVKEKEVDMIYFDGQFLLRAEPENGLDAEEMAYFIAGGIAKGLHDNKTIVSWQFRTNDKGEIDFLDDNEVYTPLKVALLRNGKMAEFKDLIEKAYIKDKQEGRHYDPEFEFNKTELEIKEKIKEQREKMAKRSDDAYWKKQNADFYLAMGMSDSAEKELSRMYKLFPEGYYVEYHSGLAKVYSMKEDIGAAATEISKLANQQDCAYIHEAKAYLYRAKGENDLAEQECNIAIAMNEGNTDIHRIKSDILSEQGKDDEARNEFALHAKFLSKWSDNNR